MAKEITLEGAVSEIDLYPKTTELVADWREQAYELFNISSFSDPANPEAAQRYLQGRLKRTVDFVIAGALAPFAEAVIHLAGSHIRRIDGGDPIFDAGDGYHSKEKIRTYILNAQQRQREELDPRYPYSWHKQHGNTDQYILPGRFIRFLRASSLDEVPQVLQILRGEMTFVGPRLLDPCENERLDQFCNPVLAQRYRQRVQTKKFRPGALAAYAAMDRGMAVENRVLLDDQFLDRARPAVDFRIGAKLFKALKSAAAR